MTETWTPGERVAGVVRGLLAAAAPGRTQKAAEMTALAAKLGMSRQSLCNRLSHPPRRAMTVDELLIIADHFGVTATGVIVSAETGEFISPVAGNRGARRRHLRVVGGAS